MNVRMEKTLLPDRNTLCLSGMLYGFRGDCEKAPNGTLQVYFQEAGKESFSMTTLLQCYTGKKGRRYTIWGKHRIYEGYSGPVVLRNVPDGVKDIIQEDAEKYGTIIE